MTVKERSIELFKELGKAQFTAEKMGLIEKALKEEGKITRCACVENINKIKARFLDDTYPMNATDSARDIIKQVIISTKSV